MSILKLNSVNINTAILEEEPDYYVESIIHTDSGYDYPVLINDTRYLQAIYGDFEYKAYFDNLIDNNIPVLVLPLVYGDFKAERASLRISNYVGKPTSNYIYQPIQQTSTYKYVHNLGYYPLVTISDNQGNRINPADIIKYDDENSFTILNIDQNCSLSIDIYDKSEQYIYLVSKDNPIEIELSNSAFELIVIDAGTKKVARDSDYKVTRLSQNFNGIKIKVEVINPRLNYLVVINNSSKSQIVNQSIISYDDNQVTLDIGSTDLKVINILNLVTNEYVTNPSSISQINYSTDLNLNFDGNILKLDNYYEISYRNLDTKDYNKKQEEYLLTCHPKIEVPGYLDKDLYESQRSGQMRVRFSTTREFRYRHNLGYYPEITLVNHNGERSLANIVHIDKNEVLVSFDGYNFNGTLNIFPYDITKSSIGIIEEDILPGYSSRLYNVDDDLGGDTAFEVQILKQVSDKYQVVMDKIEYDGVNVKVTNELHDTPLKLYIVYDASAKPDGRLRSDTIIQEDGYEGTSKLIDHGCGGYPVFRVTSESDGNLVESNTSITDRSPNESLITINALDMNTNEVRVFWKTPNTVQVSNLFRYDDLKTWNYIIDYDASQVVNSIDQPNRRVWAPDQTQTPGLNGRILWMLYPLCIENGGEVIYGITSETLDPLSPSETIYELSDASISLSNIKSHPELDNNGQFDLTKLYAAIKIDMNDPLVYGLNKIQNIYDLISEFIKLYLEWYGSEFYEEDHAGEFTATSFNKFRDHFISIVYLYDFRLYESKELVNTLFNPSFDYLFTSYDFEGVYPLEITDITDGLLSRIILLIDNKINNDYFCKDHVRLFITTAYQTDGRLRIRNANYIGIGSLNESQYSRLVKSQVEAEIVFNYNQDVLTYITDNYKLLDFYSKFYGPTGSSTSVSIEKVFQYDNFLYKLNLSNGPINETYLICTDPDRLSSDSDYIDPSLINLESKLVRVYNYNYVLTDINDKGELIVTARYDQSQLNEHPELKYDPDNVVSIIVPEYSGNMRRDCPTLEWNQIRKLDIERSIDLLLNDDYYPDLFISNYLYKLSDLSNYDWISMLIDYNKKKFNQSLQVIPSDNTLFIDNLKSVKYKDLFKKADNRMLLFYDNIGFQSASIPQHYPYCINIIKNNYLGEISDSIIAPLRGDDYESYRLYLNELNVNYLNYNGLKYYYTKLAEPTQRSVFVIQYLASRISRSLLRNENKMIARKLSDIHSLVSNTLSDVKNSSNLINSIDYDIVADDKSRRISITTKMQITRIVNQTFYINIVIN